MRECPVSSTTSPPSLLFLGVLLVTLLSPSAQAAPRWRWRQLQPTPSPPPSLGHRMVYDALRQRVVLIGGATCCPAALQNDVWEWDGTSWAQIPSSLSPSPHPSPSRWMGAAAFDASSGKILYFGGKPASSGVLGDSWTWDGSLWSPLPKGADDPKSRWRAVALGSTGDAGVFLLMGVQSQGFLDIATMSSFQGGSWKSLSVLPPSRIDLAAAWSSSFGQALTFGGRSCANSVASCAVWGELSTWKPGDPFWTVLPEASGGPQARWGAALVVHETEKKAILVGGQDADGLIEDASNPGETATWILDLVSLSWEKLPEVSLPSRVYPTAVWDEARHQIFLVGGSRWTENTLTFDDLSKIPPAQLLGDTWVLDRLGVSCNADPECSTGLCVNGVCCEQTCGACQRCDAPGQEGLCSPVLLGQDPDSCPSFCDETGACLAEGLSEGKPCKAAQQCTSGFCVDGFCCTQDSCGVCERCGEQGLCQPISGDDPDSCSTTCLNGGCKGQERKAGEPCSYPTQCGSGSCVDGTCCEKECALCETCAVANGAEIPGVCAPLRCSDPFERCDETRGVRQCVGGVLPLLAACGEGRHCASGLCLDGRCCDPKDPACGWNCLDSRTARDEVTQETIPCKEGEVCLLGRCVGPPRCSPAGTCPGALLTCTPEGWCVLAAGGRAFDRDTPIDCICHAAGRSSSPWSLPGGALAAALLVCRRRWRAERRRQA
jgi:hypothetical protein